MLPPLHFWSQGEVVVQVFSFSQAAHFVRNIELSRSSCQLLITLAVYDTIFVVSPSLCRSSQTTGGWSFLVLFPSDTWTLRVEYSAPCLALPDALWPNILEWVGGVHSLGEINLHCLSHEVIRRKRRSQDSIQLNSTIITVDRIKDHSSRDFLLSAGNTSSFLSYFSPDFGTFQGEDQRINIISD